MADKKFRPYDDPDLRELFKKKGYASLGLDPKTSTVADYLDTDDRVSFRDTPAKASATMTLSASTRLWVKQRLGDMSS
jgi:hypothetical protein